MTQYNTLNLKLFNLHLIKLKSATKNGTEVTLNLSSSLIGNSNDETNFPHKSLLTNTQVSKIRKGSSANIKFSKTQLSKMMQLAGFALNEITGPLIKGLESMPKFIDNKRTNVLNNKDKIFDTVKTVDNSIKGIKSIKRFLEQE